MINVLSWFAKRKATGDGFGPAADYWYKSVERPVYSGVGVDENTAMNYSAAWAATRLLCGTLGRLPLNLYRRGTDRGKAIAVGDPRNRIMSHAPNANMTPFMFKSQGLNSQLNRGNFYAEIQRNHYSKEFIGLWPIDNSRVTPVVDESHRLFYRVKNNDGTEIDIPQEDVLNFPAVMSSDGIVGKGIISQARESIGFGLATERYGAAWFGKGGIPRVVVSHPAKLSDTARANFRKEWKDIYSGPDGDRVALLQEGAVANPLNITPEDSQFLATRQHNVEEMARWYGVPQHKIQHLLRSTNNNIEHQALEFITDSLMPWLVIWEEELDKKLLSDEEREGMFFAFNVNEYIRGDTTARGEYWNKLVNSGIATRNEARVEEDLNPVPGGDTFLVQGAMVALDDDGSPQPSATAMPEADPAADDQEPEDDEEPEDDAQQSTAAAAEVMLQGCLSRMMTKEIQAARRAANKPGEFMTWIDSFYARHGEQLAESLSHIVMAISYLGMDASSVASGWTEYSRSLMLDASGRATAAELPGVVETMTAEWESVRIPEAVNRVFHKGAAA